MYTSLHLQIYKGDTRFRGMNTFTAPTDKAGTAAREDYTQMALRCNGVTLENTHLQPIRCHMQTLYSASSPLCFVWPVSVFTPLKRGSSTDRHQFMDSSMPSGMVVHLFSDMLILCGLQS